MTEILCQLGWARGRGRGRRARSTCSASGWRLHASCVDGRGITVCPSCEREVATTPDAALGVRVRVIDGH